MVYLKYFGLTERPFSIAPDPNYLYMSARHKEAMAHLSYGLSQGGCLYAPAMPFYGSVLKATEVLQAPPAFFSFDFPIMLTWH